MSERSFWMYNMIGSVIWAITINILGIYFVASYEVILDHFGKVAMGVLLVVFGYFYFFRRESLTSYMRAKEREIREKEELRRSRKKEKKITQNTPTTPL
jgi:uncharacterized protein YacL